MPYPKYPKYPRHSTQIKTRHQQQSINNDDDKTQGHEKEDRKFYFRRFPNFSCCSFGCYRGAILTVFLVFIWGLNPALPFVLFLFAAGVLLPLYLTYVFIGPCLAELFFCWRWGKHLNKRNLCCVFNSLITLVLIIVFILFSIFLVSQQPLLWDIFREIEFEVDLFINETKSNK